MKSGKIRLSLRYKLLIVLTLLPVVCLSLYLWMATRLFERDKVAYVFDSSVMMARSLSAQIKSELNVHLEQVKPLIETFNVAEKKFSEASEAQFARQEHIRALVLLQRQPNGTFMQIGLLTKTNNATDALPDLAKYYEKAIVNGISAEPHSDDSIVVSSFVNNGPESQFVIVALTRARELLEPFVNSPLHHNFVIGKMGRILFAPKDGLQGYAAESEFSELFKPVLNSKLPEGTAEVQSQQGEKLLISYAEVGVGGMLVTSVVSKRMALKAVDVLVAKSLLFFLALISSTLLISVFASSKLTSTLRELYEGTIKIAQGQFNVRVQNRSSDEIGGLADSFNFMAGEVSRLMSETAEKARMQTELETVRTVQETLFPPLESDMGQLRIRGHFEPASECGGDWWNYSKVDQIVYLWIGDATGHGAPAALITSAARSAAAIIETLPSMGPARALEIMNRAIYETSKGKIMMTFFLACFDEATGQLRYANASHDPPYLIRHKTSGVVTKRDLEPLMDVVGPRLGDKRDSVYKESAIQLNAGDTILFYTDGILDLKNGSGESWGERRFIKTVVESAATATGANERMKLLRDKISEYRVNSDLVDDITLFMCEYRKAA